MFHRHGRLEYPDAIQRFFPGIGPASRALRRASCRCRNQLVLYKPHRRETYERWAHSVPKHFRFSVKIPKAVTHECRLADCQDLVEVFLQQAEGLGHRLGALLVQLPPSLHFEAEIAGNFFDMLRKRPDVNLVHEPRHASWFEQDAGTLLADFGVARVAADPASVPAAAVPGGWPGLAYFRLHGAPRIYFSDYEAESLAEISRRLDTASATGAEVWCIFDNTAASYALGNALAVDAMITRLRHPRAKRTRSGA
jgi:uncharacterized protein YecE (DUF72 family)